LAAYGKNRAARTPASVSGRIPIKLFATLGEIPALNIVED